MTRNKKIIIAVILILSSGIGFVGCRAVYNDFMKIKRVYDIHMQKSAATGFVEEHDGYKFGKITLSGNKNPDAYIIVFLETKKQWGYFMDNNLENIHYNPDNPDVPLSAISHDDKCILLSVGDIGVKGRDNIFAELELQYGKIP